MGTAERRYEILKALCRRKFETIPNLSSEFGVSTRTIQRDIEVLSLSNPIYTRSGRYEGGIYVLENFSMDRMYMSDIEIKVMKKISALLDESNNTLLKDEIDVFNKIILSYSKPKL